VLSAKGRHSATQKTHTVEGWEKKMNKRKNVKRLRWFSEQETSNVLCVKVGSSLSSWEIGISLSSSRSKPMMDQLSRPTKNLIQSDWWCNMLEQWISLQVMKESLYLMLYCIKVLIPLNRAMKMMITQVPNLEDSMPYSLNNLWIEDGAIDSSLTVNCHFKSPRNCKMPIKIWSQPLVPFSWGNSCGILNSPLIPDHFHWNIYGNSRNRIPRIL